MITVVVSVYNMGKYLKKAMDCLLAQTYSDFEIILVDDGSTDGSDKICDEQGKRDDRIRVFHKPNGGLSSARNFGIDHARGEFIIFPDPDDWTEPEYLEKLLAVRMETKADLSICGHYDHIDGKIRVWNSEASAVVLHRQEAMRLLVRPSSFCGYAWNKLYRLDVIRENGLCFDTKQGMVQDLHFAVHYFLHCDTIAYDPVPLYHYNHDSGGVTASYTPLSPRKMSYVVAYETIAEEMRDVDPELGRICGASACHMSLQFIYIYYRTKMKDPGVLSELKKNYKKYRDDYLTTDAYTALDKRFCWCVPVSTRLYYVLTHLKKVYVNNFRGKRRKAGAK